MPISEIFPIRFPISEVRNRKLYGHFGFSEIRPSFLSQLDTLLACKLTHGIAVLVRTAKPVYLTHHFLGLRLIHGLGFICWRLLRGASGVIPPLRPSPKPPQT